MNILALDVGTSSVKAAVLDVEKAIPLGPIAKAAYELSHPSPEAAEVAADHLWDTFVRAARQTRQTDVEVQGIGLSCLTPALVLLNKADRPLGPFWTHLDRRARPAARKAWAEVGEEFLATTGNRPLPGGISATCWRQQSEDNPTLASETRRYLHLNGWLGLRLTGEAAFDPANASFSGLYGTMTDQKWSERWCQYFGVKPQWLPPVICGSSTLGTLRKEAAEALGLPAGIPVKLGTADTSSAMLAAEMDSEDLLHVVGTTQVLGIIQENPRPSRQRLTRRLGVGNKFVSVTHNPVGGVALEWMHQLCFRDQTDDNFYQRTIPEAERKITSETLDPPYLGGDRLEIEASYASFRELSLLTDRMDLLAALLHTMKQQHRMALTALDQKGPFRKIFLTGGGAEVVKRLIPEYRHAAVELIEEGSLRGVARLFQT